MDRLTEPTIKVAEGCELRLMHVAGSAAFKSTADLTIIRWTPDGTGLRVLEHVDPAVLRVCDVGTGAWSEIVATLLGPLVEASPPGVAIVRNTARRSRGGYPPVELHDLDGGLIATLPRGAIATGALTASASGRVVAVRVDNEVSVYTSAGRDSTLDVGGPGCVVMAADGSKFLWLAPTTKRLIVRPTAGGPSVVMPPTSGATINVASFGADGGCVVVGLSDGTVARWDPGARTLRWRLAAHTTGVVAVASSPDGGTFYSLGDDQRVCATSADGEARWSTTLRRAVTVERARTEPPSRVVRSSWAGRRTLDDRPGRIVPSPDGATLAVDVRGRGLRVLDASTGRERSALAGHDRRVTCLAVSTDGCLVASGGADGDVRVYDAATGETAWVLEVDADEVTSVEFLPDRAALRTCGLDGTVRRWSLATGLEEARWSVEGTDAVFYTRGDQSGSRVLVRRGPRLELWSDQGADRVVWSQVLDDGFHEAFSKDGHDVLTCTKLGEMRLVALDAATGRLLGAARRLRDNLVALQDTDGGPVSVTLYLYQLVVTEEWAAGREQRFSIANRDVRHAVLSADGRWLAAATDQQVDVWSRAEPHGGFGRVVFGETGDRPTTVALSADGSLLAVGTELGCVLLLSLSG